MLCDSAKETWKRFWYLEVDCYWNRSVAGMALVWGLSSGLKLEGPQREYYQGFIGPGGGCQQGLKRNPGKCYWSWGKRPLSYSGGALSPKSPAIMWKIGNIPNAINNLVRYTSSIESATWIGQRGPGCIAQGTLSNILWGSIWEKNLKGNGCVYMRSWITLLYSRNYYNLINQLYFNKTFENEKKKSAP